MIALQYTIDTENTVKLNWAAKGAERIIQNVYNLINTWKYEVAYHRTMGMSTAFLDKPYNTAAALYVSEVYKIVSAYEPRAEVKDVKISSIDNDGNIGFKVVIEI